MIQKVNARLKAIHDNKKVMHRIDVAFSFLLGMVIMGIIALYCLSYYK